MASTPLLASAAGQLSVTSSAAGQFARLAQIDHAHDDARHAGGDAAAILGSQRLAERELDAESLGDDFDRRLDAA